jgi:hypothetical protein
MIRALSKSRAEQIITYLTRSRSRWDAGCTIRHGCHAKLQHKNICRLHHQAQSEVAPTTRSNLDGVYAWAPANPPKKHLETTGATLAQIARSSSRYGQSQNSGQVRAVPSRLSEKMMSSTAAPSRYWVLYTMLPLKAGALPLQCSNMVEDKVCGNPSMRS